MNHDINEIKAEIFNALAHPLRIKIIEILKNGRNCVCNITTALGAEQSNVSHHLSILKNAGIVRCDKKGHEVWYEVVDKRIFKLLNVIECCIIDNLKKNSELLKKMKGE